MILERVHERFQFLVVSKIFLIGFDHILHFEAYKRNNMRFKLIKKGFEVVPKCVQNKFQIGQKVFS